MPFLNKVVLITGAGSGLGEKTALHFAKLSARLALVDISEQNLKKSAEKCEKASRTTVFKVFADLTKDEDVKRAIQSTVKQYGKIDVVVNCVGIFGVGSITDDNLIEAFDRVLAADLRAVVAVTHFAAPALIESKGCIINISSVAAVSVVANIPYATAKAGLCHFTKCVALELAPKGVRVNSVLPGIVKTNILLNSGFMPETNDSFMKKAETLAPIKGLVKPEDVADLITFLASDKARSLTGCNYSIDNGVALTGISALSDF